MIIAGLIHFSEYLQKNSRYENAKEVNKLKKEFESFDDFVVYNQ